MNMDTTQVPSVLSTFQEKKNNNKKLTFIFIHLLFFNVYIGSGNN